MHFIRAVEKCDFLTSDVLLNIRTLELPSRHQWSLSYPRHISPTNESATKTSDLQTPPKSWWLIAALW